MKDYFKLEISQDNLLAIPLERTAEVLSVHQGEICPICGVNSAILGVINHRGKLLWIADMCKILQLIYHGSLEKVGRKIQTHEKLTIIILKNQEKQIGAVVTALKGIVTLDIEKFDLSVSNTPRKTYLISQPEKILDVDAVFTVLKNCVVKIN